MSIWGKILGSAAGLAMGGPVGGLLGLALGAAVDKGVSVHRPDKNLTKHVTFTIGVIALAAKMARADGQVTSDEVQAFRQVFRVAPSEIHNVERIFNLARQHVAGYEAYARQIAFLLKDQKPVLNDLLDALFFIAKADGQLHPKEIAYLKSVADIFGIEGKDFDFMQSRHGDVPCSAYELLGVKADIDPQALKARYHELVKKNHPDLLMAQGVPPDLIRVANRRLAEINQAYREILQKRSK